MPIIQNEYFVQLGADGEIVETYEPVPAVSLPYVACDVDGVLRYVERHSKFIYKIMQLKHELPDYFTDLVARGRRAVLSDDDELSWRKDFANKFTYEFPVTSSDLVQVSIFECEEV